MTEHTIGIDISKSLLDVFHLEEQAAERFENFPRGFRALQKWLLRFAVTRLVYEPTAPITVPWRGRFRENSRW